MYPLVIYVSDDLRQMKGFNFSYICIPNIWENIPLETYKDFISIYI